MLKTREAPPGFSLENSSSSIPISEPERKYSRPHHSDTLDPHVKLDVEQSIQRRPQRTPFLSPDLSQPALKPCPEPRAPSPVARLPFAFVSRLSTYDVRRSTRPPTVSPSGSIFCPLSPTSSIFYEDKPSNSPLFNILKNRGRGEGGTPGEAVAEFAARNLRELHSSPCGQWWCSNRVQLSSFR